MGCNSPGQGRWAEQVKGVTPLQERLQEAVEAMGVERCCWEEWLCCWLNLEQRFGCCYSDPVMCTMI